MQGRHAEQTSDALGAVSGQIGPRAKALAAFLHYGLGLSFKKTSALLARFGIGITAGAPCSSAQSTSTTFVPVQASIVAELNESKAIVPEETGGGSGPEAPGSGRPPVPVSPVGAETQRRMMSVIPMASPQGID